MDKAVVTSNMSLLDDHENAQQSEWQRAILARADAYRASVHYSEGPAEQDAETAIARFWREPTVERAGEYLSLVLPLIANARRQAYEKSQPNEVQLREPQRFGPYLADTMLGSGHDGAAFQGYHESNGTVVTIKVPAHGDAMLFWYLGDDWHPALLRVYDTGDLPTPTGNWPWVARENAEVALSDVLSRGEPLATTEALGVFATCCEAVSWLHSRHIYRWSAHVGNVFRVGHRWKVGDYGRCLVFLPSDHDMLDLMRERFLDVTGEGGEEGRKAADFCAEAFYFGHPSATGFFPFNLERERRLMADDCSMLAGLLADLLAGKRWASFFRALNKQPYCSAHYRINGDRDIDDRLSAIFNRAWRGDEGGGPLIANDGRGEQTVYTDPLEMLADARDVLQDYANTEG